MTNVQALQLIQNVPAAPHCLTSNKDAAVFNQTSHEFTAAYAALILNHLKSHKTQAWERAEWRFRTGAAKCLK